jgi:NTP pyrophosphatase (non-canonical NTP hydrolase)
MEHMMNYQQEALRTKSPQFHLSPKALGYLAGVAAFAVVVGKPADSAKRAMFYGKPMPEDGSFNGHTDQMEQRARDLCPDDNSIREGYDPSHLNADQVHGILGIFTEACELMELLFDSMESGQPIDRAKLENELGDVSWYHAIACEGAGTTVDNVHDKNIAKLKARYPDKFTSEAACNRDEDKEYVAMANAGQ